MMMRKLVILLHGVFLFYITSCTSKVDEKNTAINPFTGKVTISVHIEGPDSIVKKIDRIEPEYIQVFINDSNYVIAYMYDSIGFRVGVVDYIAETALFRPDTFHHFQPAKYYSPDDYREKLEPKNPYFFKTELDTLDERQTIAGYDCKRFKVRKSAFIDENVDAYIWVTDDLEIPDKRYSISSGNMMVSTPLLMSIPVGGEILALELHYPEYTIIYTVESLDAGVMPQREKL